MATPTPVLVFDWHHRQGTCPRVVPDAVHRTAGKLLTLALRQPEVLPLLEAVFDNLLSGAPSGSAAEGRS